jgi:hypothetical protein
MRDHKFVNGTTPDEKFNSIETMFQRFSRRLHRTVMMVTPPSVIGNYEAVLPADGVVLRTIFPCDGTIESLVMHTTSEQGKRQQTSVYILNGASQKVYSSSFSEPIPVKKGDMAAVKIEGECGNIWASILFNGDWLSGKKETIAIEQLEKVVEDFSKGD